MLTKTATGLALVLALLATPVLAQTDTPTPPPPMVDGQTPPPPPPGGPADGGPMKGKQGMNHGRMMMMPPPPPMAMIKVALGKDQMLEIACGDTPIAACVEASKAVLDRFLKE